MIDLGITPHNDVKGEFELSTQWENVCHTGILRDRNAHQD